MGSQIVLMPKYPECWKSCGDCARGDVFVLDVLVKKGDWVDKDDNILSLETGKVALDIPTPYQGVVDEIYVRIGQTLEEMQPLIKISGNFER